MEDDWGFEWIPEARTFLVIELGHQAIKNADDCMQLFEELESLVEDYPNYLPVFKVGNGAP